MRAARVLDMLLVLQRRGRTTARQLAEILEVSERTILRDVDAFSEAGVPIVTTRGAGGGIELLDGFQTQLTGLTSDEALCLFLVGQPQLAHRLGLGAPTRTARNKLLSALPAMLAEEADRLAAWLLHDPDPWTGTRIPHGELRRVARTIQHRRIIEITIAQGPAVSVRPLALVLKAGSWYLVMDGEGSPEVLCIDELRATRLTNRNFTPPAEFDLVAFWDSQINNPLQAAAMMAVNGDATRGGGDGNHDARGGISTSRRSAQRTPGLGRLGGGAAARHPARARGRRPG